VFPLVFLVMPRLWVGCVEAPLRHGR
jgi:hypothetical protein